MIASEGSYYRGGPPAGRADIDRLKNGVTALMRASQKVVLLLWRSSSRQGLM